MGGTWHLDQTIHLVEVVHEVGILYLITLYSKILTVIYIERGVYEEVSPLPVAAFMTRKRPEKDRVMQVCKLKVHCIGFFLHGKSGWDPGALGGGAF